MSMVAIFELECCHRKIVFGRFRGRGEPHPGPDFYKKNQYGWKPRFSNGLDECPFGCAPTFGPYNTRLLHDMRFVRYQEQANVPKTLMDTWKFPDRGRA